MKAFEISDKVSSIAVVSVKLKAVIDILVNNLAEADFETARHDFNYRTEMYCNLIYIANDLNYEAVYALEALSKEIEKNSPAPTKATGE